MSINTVTTGGFGISGGLTTTITDIVTRGYSFGVAVIVVTPVSRIFAVVAESRTHNIDSENRINVIEYENRVKSIEESN